MNKKGNSKPRRQNTNRGRTGGEANDVWNQMNGNNRNSGNNQSANSRRESNNSNRDNRDNRNPRRGGGSGDRGDGGGRDRSNSSSRYLKMITTLPPFDGNSIEDYLDDLYRISANNIKVKMSMGLYKTFICQNVARGEECPDMKKYGKCRYAHSCDEQSFLVNSMVYQMMVRSEGVFPSFIKEVSDRISDISNHKLLQNFWRHWTGYIDSDSHKIRDERCEWIPFGSFSDTEPDTFMSLLLPHNWGNRLIFDNFKGTLASRDLSSILIDLVQDEEERRKFMKDSFSHELYKVVISFDDSKECKEFLNYILNSLEDYTDKEKIEFFTKVASCMSTFVVKKKSSDDNEVSIRKDNPYAFDEKMKFRDNVSQLKGQFDDIKSDIKESETSDSKKRHMIQKINRIQEEIIGDLINWKNPNNKSHLGFCVEDFLISILNKRKKITPIETLNFLIDYICNKIINRKMISDSIKEFKEKKSKSPKRKEMVSSTQMEMKIKAIRDANVRKFKDLVKRYRVMNPELFEFLSGNAFKIAEEEQRRSRICPKYRTYLTRNLLGDNLSDIYCSNLKDKRQVDRFKCSCNGGINCKHGLHLDAFTCKNIPVDHLTPIGEADDVSKSLMLNVPDSYNPYSNPSIDSKEINKLFIEGRNMFSIDDYADARKKLQSGYPEDQLVDDIKNDLDAKIRSAFQRFQISLKYKFVNSEKNINSEQIRQEGTIEKSTFKRWNTIQNDKHELLNLFANLEYLKENSDSRSDTVLDTLKRIFSKELKDESDRSNILGKVKKILNDRLDELKQNIYTKMFRASVNLQRDQTHYIPALNNSIYLKEKEVIVAPSLEHMMSQPSACINNSEKFVKSLVEKHDSDMKWGNDDFVSNHHSEYERSRKERRRIKKIDDFKKKQRQRNALRTIKKWFSKHEHKFQDKKWVNEVFSKIKGYKVVEKNNTKIMIETDTPFDFYVCLRHLCKLKYTTKSVIGDVAQSKFREICIMGMKKMESKINYFLTREKHKYFENLYEILNRMYRSKLGPNIAELWEKKKFSEIKDILDNVGNFRTRQRNVVLDALIKVKIDPMYLNKSVTVPKSLQSMLKNDLNLKLSRTDYMVIFINHIFSRLSRWSKNDDGKWTYHEPEVVESEADDVERQINVVTESHDIKFQSVRRTKSIKISPLFDIEQVQETGTLTRHNINSVHLEKISNFFDFDVKMLKKDLRVIGSPARITCHNESFKALTKLRKILSVWSQIQNDIHSQELEIDEMKSVEDPNLLVNSISNESIIKDKENYIVKLNECMKKSISSISKKLICISEDPYNNSLESKFVDSVIRFCQTEFDIKIKMTSGNEIEDQIQELEEKLKDSKLSKNKKKKLKMKWKELIRKRKSHVPSLSRTVSYNVEQEHKILKRDMSKVDEENDDDSESSGSESDSGSSDSETDYDTDDSDDDSDEDDWKMGGFNHHSRSFIDPLSSEDKNVEFGKKNFTPSIKVSHNEITTKKKGKGGKVSQNKQSQKIVTLSGLHSAILMKLKKLINFCACRLLFNDQTGSHFIEFRFKDKSGSKKSEGGIPTTIENLVKIIHSSLHECNKRSDNYIIDEILQEKTEKIKNLKRKIKSGKGDEHTLKKELKKETMFVEYFDDNVVNKILVDSTASELSYLVRQSYVTTDNSDYKIVKFRGEADDVEDAMNSDDEDGLNALGLPKNQNKA